MFYPGGVKVHPCGACTFSTGRMTPGTPRGPLRTLHGAAGPQAFLTWGTWQPTHCCLRCWSAQLPRMWTGAMRSCGGSTGPAPCSPFTRPLTRWVLAGLHEHVLGAYCVLCIFIQFNGFYWMPNMPLYLFSQYLLYTYCVVFSLIKQNLINLFIDHLLYMPIFM